MIGAAENSVFTHFMIEGLKTGAADTDNDGQITLEELNIMAVVTGEGSLTTRLVARVADYAAEDPAQHRADLSRLANLAERMGADIEKVRMGIGSDPRIGYSFIYPGAGYGGSCFPKDVQALERSAQELKYDAALAEHAWTRTMAFFVTQLKK